jgi:phage-related protein
VPRPTTPCLCISGLTIPLYYNLTKYYHVPASGLNNRTKSYHVPASGLNNRTKAYHVPATGLNNRTKSYHVPASGLNNRTKFTLRIFCLTTQNSDFWHKPRCNSLVARVVTLNHLWFNTANSLMFSAMLFHVLC